MSEYIRTTGSQKGPDGRWTHYFSQSFVSNFQKCPEQARAIYAREYPSTTTDSTALGSACHLGFEYALHEKMAGREPNLDDMIQVVHHDLDETEWKYTKMSRATVYEVARDLQAAWLESLYPLANPWRVEQKFSILLYSGKHRDVYMNGTIDMIDDAGVTWDWKTASRPYERWEKQRWAVQPTVYALATQELLDADDPNNQVDRLSSIGGVEFHYGIVMYDGSTEVVTVFRTSEHLAWLREQCSQIAWMIEHEVNPWPMNDAGWWCGPKWCPVFAAGECKGKHISEGWAT